LVLHRAQRKAVSTLNRRGWRTTSLGLTVTMVTIAIVLFVIGLRLMWFAIHR
jgi:hypothetical protein